MTVLKTSCVTLVPRNWTEPHAVPVAVPSHSVPELVPPVVRTKFEPASVNCALPLKRDIVTPDDAVDPVNVQELEFAVPAAEPPRRSICMTGLSTGLLNVIVTVEPVFGIVSWMDGTPAIVAVGV